MIKKQILFEEYNEKWRQVQEGEITTEEWTAFCGEILDQILKENEEIFKRLQNEWAE